MRLLDHAQLQPDTLDGSVLTIGNFDGVHRGHQALLRTVVERARVLGLPSAVYTFHPHPLKVLNPAACPLLICSFEDRCRRIEALGVQLLVRARFDREYGAQEPAVFAREVLASRLGAREIWVGPDFAFGHGRRGNLDLLRRVGRQEGFDVRVLEPYAQDGRVVSSTRVRRAVATADFQQAEALLGRPFRLHGPVVHGAARGRKLGYPTANVLIREECRPPPGVYAALVEAEGQWHTAALNLGPNPTFSGTEMSVEAYLLDFEGTLYGREVRVEPVERIRGEVAFRTVDDLVTQVGRDVAEVRRRLSPGRDRVRAP